MGLSTRRLLAAASPAGRLISLLLLWTYVGSSASAPVPVLLGVVLDLAGDGGMKSLACISMALDDFYLEHPTYATRVELRVRDSRGDLVAAGRAAEELMDKNSQVQAIISPHTSPQGQTELFAGIAERGNIPILSSSTTAPASTSSQSRFLVGTAPNISSQAAPIAAILEAFAWRATVLVHEDSPYGVGILSALVHAFRGSRVVLTDSVAVASDATDSRLDAALLAVRNMPTRVYIVHMPPAFAARLFSRAAVAGMMSEGYVWIATAGVGNAVDSLANHGDMDNMQGVVTLLPHVPVTEQVRSFSRRFKVNFRPDGEPGTPVWLLWLYDTAWAAAAAAEASFGRAQPTTFLDALLVTEFDGLAGRFRLVDGQLQVSAYEIVNIIGKGARTVGFWTPETGISTSLYPSSAGKALKQILWPGETAAVPVGWTESPGGRALRVAVPVKRGFNQFVEVSGGPSTASERVSGYCIDVFHAVMTRLNYPVAYSYVPVNESMLSYDELVNLVHDKKADAVAGDVTITSSRMKLVSFTMPFADTGWSMIRAKEDSSMWMFTKPMTPELWITSLAFFFFTGFVVWAIEHSINPRFRGTPWKQLGVLFYFAFSTMVFSHKEKLESNLSKLVVIMWVFVVLILTTSYTANLTSVLTVQQLQPEMKDLTDRDYVGFQDGSFIEGLLREMGFDQSRFRSYSSMDQYADALDKGSDHGGVTAIFDEVPYLRLFLSRYCNGYYMVGPTYKSCGFGFVFPLGSPLVADVSLAILELAEEDKLARIESKWFSHPGACVSGSSDGSDARLGLWRFRGLFLINAVVSCLMLLIHLVRFVSQKRARGDQLGADAAAAGALPWLHAWLRRFGWRRGEPVSDGHGAAELNSLHVLADGCADQQGAMEGSHSTPVDATDSGRNAAANTVSDAVSPVGASSIGQSVHEPAARLDVHENAAQTFV